jgi:CBS domain-containing protein
MEFLTEKDILWAVVKKSKHDLEKILAKDVMKKKVITIKPIGDIDEALSRMRKKRVSLYP